ncbi:ABC transporter substrate-binding protein [Bradyrhizobium sp. SEMIA]|uniref:ABC transporter substrate-binding protein n=1 Tax=Bradyrhizobium sp. SEMIA TaxID=2597515 RepID=UPI0018A4B648|nr:extracellular solute-binding protein [Bradyrhizobium sp. SEMIA]QOG23843.1 extracellular solute-binding protein [Bradyrhizobium sp. SEMIA]
MKRRTFLKAVTAAAASVLGAPNVHGQSKKFAGITLRINGFGGVWDDALMKGVAAPLEEKYGLKVQFFAGSQSADFVKLLANKEKPPFDLFQADDIFMLELIKAGLINEINASDVPNVKRILPGFRAHGDYGAPFNVASIHPIYNSKYIKQPLTSYSDIARPDLKSRAVVPSPNLTTSLFLLGLAEENGGSITNMEPAYKILEAAKPNIVAIAQTTVAQLQMLQNEEAYGGVFLAGSAYKLRTMGVPIEIAIPPKGFYALTSYMNLVRGMKYPEAGHAFVEQLLSDQGMLAIPQAIRYGVTTDVKLPKELSRDLILKAPNKVDWSAWGADTSARIERVNKILRS